jgi:hypothetical protein
MTFLHSVGVYGIIVKSVTGPGRGFLLLAGIAGSSNAGGSEGGTDEKRFEFVSKSELRTRGMRRAIVFGLLLLTTTTVLFSFVLQYHLRLRSRMDLPPPAPEA